MANLSDLDIQALVDQELDAENEKRVTQQIAENPLAAKRYRQLVLQKELLLDWWVEETKAPKKSVEKRARAAAYIH